VISKLFLDLVQQLDVRGREGAGTALAFTLPHRTSALLQHVDNISGVERDFTRILCDVVLRGFSLMLALHFVDIGIAAIDLTLFASIGVFEALITNTTGALVQCLGDRHVGDVAGSSNLALALGGFVVLELELFGTALRIVVDRVREVDLQQVIVVTVVTHQLRDHSHCMMLLLVPEVSLGTNVCLPISVFFSLSNT
jgi:hypothetical protein